MYIINHYSHIDISEVININNSENLDLFINTHTIDVWESNPFK